MDLIFSWINTFETDTVVLFSGIGIFLLLTIYWHRDKTNPFDFKSALMEDDKLSLSKMGQLVALLVSTWIIIHQVRIGGLSEWLFGGYMLAWGGANAINKYINSRSMGYSNPYTVNSQPFVEPYVAPYVRGE